MPGAERGAGRAQPSRRDARQRGLQAAYDREADRYEERFGALQAPKLAAALSRCAPQPGERLLDLGCGTGLLLRALPADAWGLDLSAGMLARAPGPRRVQADLLALPFGAASFDRVYCLTALLGGAREGALAFAELGRVLRPGGELCLTLLERDAWAELELDLRAAGLEPRERFRAGQDLGWVARRGPGARALESPPGS